MEGRLDSCGALEAGPRKKRRLDGQSWRSEGSREEGSGRKRGSQERGGRSQAGLARERSPWIRTAGKGGFQEGQEKEKEGDSEVEALRRQERPVLHFRGNWLRPRSGGQEGRYQDCKEDSQKDQEKEEEEFQFQRDYIRDELIRNYSGPGGHGDFRGSKGVAPPLAKGSRITFPGDDHRSSTELADASGHPARDISGGFATPDGPVLQGQSPTQYDSRFVKGGTSLGNDDRHAPEGRSGAWVRPGVPTPEELGVLFERDYARHQSEPGVAAAGEGHVDVDDGDVGGQQTSAGGAEADSKDEVSRKGQRIQPCGRRRKERKGKGRWQERQGRAQRAAQGKGGREGECFVKRRRLKRRRAKATEKEAGGEKQSWKGGWNMGVPGGIGSRGGEKFEREDPKEGKCFTVASEPEVYLPEGDLGARIHAFAKFEDLLEWTWDAFSKLRNKMRRQLTMAKDCLSTLGSKDCIFPLPVSQVSDSALRSTVGALNDLAGFSPVADMPDQSAFSLEVVKNLGRLVHRFDIWKSEPPEVSFKQLWSSKTLDYVGEEVKVAQRLKWQAVAPSLPEGVGQLPLEEFCRLGTLHYVQHFTDYLLPADAMQAPRPPAVMVEPESWDDLCLGLVGRKICDIWPVDELFHCDGKPLLNGLFAVGKGEFVDGVETQRLIMNLTPVNSLTRSLKGDVGTLPGLAGFAGFLLEEGQVALLSSEDIRCFFYLFAVPAAWQPFLGFNREVSPSLVPPHLQGRKCVLVSRVLPMGFANSVSIAQHIHRNIVRWSAMKVEAPIGGEGELRKDRGMSSAASLYRVYLDNFDQLERFDKATADLVVGTPSAQVLKLRQDYMEMGLPRHPKKAVQRQFKAEVQGALFDGLLGFAMPKVGKVWQYALLAVELLSHGSATLKELQVVCGGFVYMALFRRPLLCSLNEVWAFMQQYQGGGGRRALPTQVQAEIAPFVLLLPLAQMEFKAQLCDQVTCSDASMVGGGICVSEGLTSYGVAAANSMVRGDIPESHDMIQVLTVGLFDGIGALRLAADTLGLPVAGHVSVEQDAKGRRVVESWFPGSIFFEDVRGFQEAEIAELALEFSNVGLVLIGAGPPCQGVSGLNADKKGALKDSRSSLFQEVPRIEECFRRLMPWAQVHRLMESVASMSPEDQGIMSEGVQRLAYRIDSFGLTLCHRPRLYWPTWELQSADDVEVEHPQGCEWESCGTVRFFGSPDHQALLEPGWAVADSWGLPTFTTSRPRSNPGRRPAGLKECQAHELQRWREDLHRFPPYQYRDGAGLYNKKGEWRRPSVAEREALMGFPVGYTAPCVPKAEQKGELYEDSRLSLLGNSWQVGVIVWLLGQLCAPLGLCEPANVEEIIKRTTPGQGAQLQSLLLRPPLHRSGSVKMTSSRGLIRKMMGIVSMKGEDLLLQGSSELLVKYHRLRASIPAKLWKWREVAGWSWRSHQDHINVLELRAILTSIRGWVKKRKCTSSRFLHLTDSLVCLHSLCRGRTSSKKMRRTLIRINSILLAADLHPMWGYVHTKQNPADRPSRRPFRRKWQR